MISMRQLSTTRLGHVLDIQFPKFHAVIHAEASYCFPVWSRTTTECIKSIVDYSRELCKSPQTVWFNISLIFLAWKDRWRHLQRRLQTVNTAYVITGHLIPLIEDSMFLFIKSYNQRCEGKTAIFLPLFSSLIRDKLALRRFWKCETGVEMKSSSVWRIWRALERKK